MTIKEIEKKITEQENALRELKEELEKIKEKENENKIPDDVRDIPKYYIDDFEEHSNGSIEYYYLSQLGGDVLNNSMFAKSKVEKALLAKHRAFPNVYFAREFNIKTQLIADCLYFKWVYDREYVPNWQNNINIMDKYSVAYDTEENRYVYTRWVSLDYGTVYFSTEQIAEKCAEWLNYIYKKGKYAE